MVGSFVDRILPLEIKRQIKSGEIVVEYNGLRIERIVEVTEQVECASDQVTDQVTPKPKRKRAK